MRDIDQLLAHVHDAEIEICEGPTPPKREGGPGWRIRRHDLPDAIGRPRFEFKFLSHGRSVVPAKAKR
jgi:hypothetical protein